MERQMIAELIPGMTDALDTWLRNYEQIFITGPALPAGATEAERHARRMREAGLLGTAHAIIAQVRSNVHRAEDLGLPPELIAAIPAGAHHDTAPLPQRRGRGSSTGASPVFTPATPGGEQ